MLSPAIYQLKITLADIRPPIWRRIQVAGDTRLDKLHQILQAVMGWEDYHLHKFEMHGVSYGPKLPGLGGYQDKDERKATLSQAAPTEGSKFLYHYDFGDSWLHYVSVEKVLPRPADFNHPICIKGKRACPPEDCGGVWGYDSFVEIMANPEHPEHEDMAEWYDGIFDPEAFDLEEVNRQLKKLG